MAPTAFPRAVLSHESPNSLSYMSALLIEADKCNRIVRRTSLEKGVIGVVIVSQGQEEIYKFPPTPDLHHHSTSEYESHSTLHYQSNPLSLKSPRCAPSTIQSS